MDGQSSVESPETVSLEDIVRKLLPTPARPPPEAAPIPSNKDLLIQRLVGAIRTSQPVAQERSKLTDLEIMLQNWLPVGAVTEEDAATPNLLSGSLEGCFSCGVLTHTTDQCQTLDESFPFLPEGWQADYIGDLIRGEGLVARISNDYEPQLPVVGKDITGPAVPCHVGTARLLETMDRRTSMVGRVPCSDLDDSNDDVVYTEGHDEEVGQISLRNEWSANSWTADDSCGEGCAQLDDFNWFLPAHDRVGDISAPESRVDLSDSESDVDDGVPDTVPVQMTTTAVE